MCDTLLNEFLCANAEGRWDQGLLSLFSVSGVRKPGTNGPHISENKLL